MWCLRLFNFVFGLVCGAGQFVWHLGGFRDLIIGFVCGPFSVLCMALGLRQATGYTSPFLFFVDGHCQLFFQLIAQPLYSLLAFLQVDVRLFLVSSSFCASRVILNLCESPFNLIFFFRWLSQFVFYCHCGTCGKCPCPTGKISLSRHSRVKVWWWHSIS